MKGAMIIGAAIVLTLLMPSTLVGFWGTEGRRDRCVVGSDPSDRGRERGIRSLIGDASLASIANWADEVRPERDETYNWHFVDIPESASGFSDKRDCFLPRTIGTRARRPTITTSWWIGWKYSSRFSPTAMLCRMTASKH